MILRTVFLMMLLNLFIIFTSVSNVQSDIINETDAELIVEEISVVDTINRKLSNKNEKNNQFTESKFRIGVEFNYPFIHGGDDDFTDFWELTWHGIFSMSTDFNINIINKLGIGPVIDISLYQTNPSLDKATLIMIVTAFSTKYDIVNPNNSFIITPFINVGLYKNYFYSTHDTNEERSNDIGFICSFGSSFKVRLPIGIEIGPVFHYELIRRFYDFSEGKVIDKDNWIEKIRNFKIGLKVNIPITCTRFYNKQ